LVAFAQSLAVELGVRCIVIAETGLAQKLHNQQRERVDVTITLCSGKPAAPSARESRSAPFIIAPAARSFTGLNRQR
jgi:hypothetical protein